MDKVRLAIVGCGTISQLNVPGYLQHPMCEVVALCDPERERAERRAAQWEITPKFYARYAIHTVSVFWRVARYYAKLMPLRRKLERDPNAVHYTDRALTAPDEKDGERFQTFTAPATEPVRKNA